MRTPIVLCALLSLAAGPAPAQAPASRESWQTDRPAQRERAQERKSILEDELASEAKQLADAFAALREARSRSASDETLKDFGEQVDRHRRNVAELAHEIARAEGQGGAASAGPQSIAERPIPDKWLIHGQSAKEPDETPKRRGREALPRKGIEERGYPEWMLPSGRSGTFQ